MLQIIYIRLSCVHNYNVYSALEVWLCIRASFHLIWRPTKLAAYVGPCKVVVPADGYYLMIVFDFSYQGTNVLNVAFATQKRDRQKSINDSEEFVKSLWDSLKVGKVVWSLKRRLNIEKYIKDVYFGVK